MKSRTIFVMLVSLLLVLTLVAIPAVAQEEEKPYAGTKITVAMIDEPREQALKELTPEFEEATGIKVTVDLMGFNAITTKTLASSQAQTGEYDVMQLNYFEIPFYASSGWLYDLTEWAERDTEEIKLDDFHPVLVKTHMTYEDRYYCMPMHVNAAAFFYRTDIFKEMGFERPESWDQVVEYAKAITEKYAPETYGITLMLANDVQLGIEVLDMMAVHGGYFYDPKTYRPAMDTEAAKKTMDLLIELAKYGPPGVAGYALDQNFRSFAQGEAAMTRTWTTGVFYFDDPEKSKVVGKWDVMTIPGGYNMLGGWSLTVSEYSKNKEAAWEWIKWATSPEMEMRLIGNMECPRLSILKDEELAAKWPNNRVFLEDLEANPVMMPQVTVAIELYLKAAAEFNAALTGQKEPDQALADLQEEFKEVLIDAGYYQE